MLCQRQVLGVRSALLAAQQLPAALPQTSKRIIALVEIDGCYSDGVLVASGCSVGHLTMRVIDTGKVAARTYLWSGRHANRQMGVRLLQSQYWLAVAPPGRAQLVVDIGEFAYTLLWLDSEQFS